MTWCGGCCWNWVKELGMLGGLVNWVCGRDFDRANGYSGERGPGYGSWICGDCCGL